MKARLKLDQGVPLDTSSKVTTRRGLRGPHKQTSIHPEEIRTNALRAKKKLEGKKEPALKNPGARSTAIASMLAARTKIVEDTPQLLAEPKTVGVLGSGCGLGQPIEGTELGPAALRNHGLLEAIKANGWAVEDRGDLSFDALHRDTRAAKDGIKNSKAIGEASKRIAAETEAIAKDGRFALTIGGDHGNALGTIAGIARVHPDVSVIWVDAHGDYNSPETSPSQNFHGMPLAALTGAFDLAKHEGFEWFEAGVDPKRVAIVGARSIDPGERELLKAMGVRVFTMHDIDRFGIGAVMDLALEAVSPEGDRPLHLSFDIDSLDPMFASQTGTRERGGLTFREARYVTESLAETGRLVSMDLVEVNPKLGKEDATVEIAVELVETALGKSLM